VTAFDAAGNRSNLVSVIGTTTTCTVFADDFESGGLSAWASNVGLVAQQQVVANGAWAARATTTTAAVYAYATLPTGSTDLYLRIRFDVVSQGANSVNLVKLRTSGGGYIGGLSLSNTRKLTLRNDVASTTTTSTRTASLGAWHELQLHVVIADVDSQVAVWLDGTAVSDLTLTQGLGSAPIARVQIGDTATGRSFDVAYDDVVASSTYVPNGAAVAGAVRPTPLTRPRTP
jgi:hypothetical protein